MDAIEKRARELLAAQQVKDALGGKPLALAEGDLGYEFAIRAIVAALTPPDGYVLVPVVLPVDMEVAFMEAWVSKRRCVDDPEMQDAWAASLAARPEVP